jgi:hypothetical protein
LLATEAEGGVAVDAGALPGGVLSAGNTDDFLVGGTLGHVYGVDDSDDDDGDGDTGGGGRGAGREGGGDGSDGAAAGVAPAAGVPRRRRARAAARRVAGQCVTLRAGDTLLVPAGLYHDVQVSKPRGCASSTPPDPTLPTSDPPPLYDLPRRKRTRL